MLASEFRTALETAVGRLLRTGHLASFSHSTIRRLVQREQK